MAPLKKAKHVTSKCLVSQDFCFEIDPAPPVTPKNSFAITFSRLDILLLKNVTSYTKIMRKKRDAKTSKKLTLNLI